MNPCPLSDESVYVPTITPVSLMSVALVRFDPGTFNVQ
jgi:hypothetical protein